MDIDRLTKAANAAGYAMANSEDLLVPAPLAKKSEDQGWRAADPLQQNDQRALVPAKLSTKPAGSLRDWWFTLSSKATA